MDHSDSSSEESDNDPSNIDTTDKPVKQCIEDIYGKLDGLKFKGKHRGRREMTQHHMPEPVTRPVYEVDDSAVSSVLRMICQRIKQLEHELKLDKEIWKGITEWNGVHTIWGTNTSTDDQAPVFYQVNGIEVIIMTSDPTTQYHAIVNISVEVTSDL